MISSQYCKDLMPFIMLKVSQMWTSSRKILFFLGLFAFVVFHNQLNMQLVLYLIHMFTLITSSVEICLHMKKKKITLCIIYIYKYSLSPDKLAGEFIITPKIFVQKRNQAKKLQHL